MSDVHHYEMVVNNLYTAADGFTTESEEKHEISLNQYDYATNTVTSVVLNNPTTEEIILRANNSDLTSETVYTILKTTTYKEVFVYDYEYEQNEKNRTINILKREYIQALMTEMETMHYG
jgi:hypothetical protein